MSEEDYDYIIKVNETGGRLVGRRSLFFRYTQNYFRGNNPNIFGIDMIIKKIEIDNKLIECIIYAPFHSTDRYMDRYRQTSDRLLKHFNGTILIYDITNLESFKLIREFNKELNENGFSNLKKVLVGNKCDLEDKREVTTEEGKKLAKELGINNFFEVSAKTGKNVEEAYYSLFREILMDYKEPIPFILNDKEKKDEKKINVLSKWTSYINNF